MNYINSNYSMLKTSEMQLSVSLEGISEILAENLSLITTIGEGAFGYVVLVETKELPLRTYAVKTLKGK